MHDHAPARSAIETVWRMESARIIAGLARVLRGDVGLAEDFAQEALVAALEQWPDAGTPDNPGAWLMSTAKKRAIDALRRAGTFGRLREEMAHAAQPAVADQGAADRSLDGGVDDDVLRLVFAACHPALSAEQRSALTLRLLCGLTTDEIARAFLVPEATAAQRIVRAKRTLTEAGTPFEVPVGRELHERLSSVLEVVYLLFNEGYAATSGDDWVRRELCEEAQRLGRILAGLMPRETEVLGLCALMELHGSRLTARADSSGRPVLLMDQDRSRWDRTLIRHGLAALAEADRICDATKTVAGSYVLQARIVACHARAARPEETDWRSIAATYAELADQTPSPVIELNRAVAIGMAEGPAAGLAIADRLAEDGELTGYHLLPAVRGELLERLGRTEEARAEFERAASMTRNQRERETLLGRASRLA